MNAEERKEKQDKIIARLREMSTEQLIAFSKVLDKLEAEYKAEQEGQQK